jgi:hypothetical protein
MSPILEMQLRNAQLNTAPTIDGMAKQCLRRAGHVINNGTKTSEVSKLRMF